MSHDDNSSAFVTFNRTMERRDEAIREFRIRLGPFGRVVDFARRPASFRLGPRAVGMGVRRSAEDADTPFVQFFFEVMRHVASSGNHFRRFHGPQHV